MNRATCIGAVLLLGFSFAVVEVHALAHELPSIQNDAGSFDAARHPLAAHLEAPLAQDPAECVVCLLAPQLRTRLFVSSVGLPDLESRGTQSEAFELVPRRRPIRLLASRGPPLV